MNYTVNPNLELKKIVWKLEAEIYYSHLTGADLNHLREELEIAKTNLNI